MFLAQDPSSIGEEGRRLKAGERYRENHQTDVYNLPSCRKSGGKREADQSSRRNSAG